MHLSPPILKVAVNHFHKSRHCLSKFSEKFIVGGCSRFPLNAQLRELYCLKRIFPKIVPDDYHFGHVGKGAAVVEVKVRDDNAVDVAGESVAPYSDAVLLLRDVAEVGEPAFVLEIQNTFSLQHIGLRIQETTRKFCHSIMQTDQISESDADLEPISSKC